MAESDEIDYSLWRFRFISDIRAKGLEQVLEPTKRNGEASSSTTAGTVCEATVKQRQQANIIIVSAESDHAICLFVQ